ncbi:MAG: hypothetical protein ABI557_02105 [Aureliella sp.]
MNRLLSLLLIPFFVLGQALPHSHAGTGVHQPADHAARPHVHLSGGHSHNHDCDDHSHSHVDQVALANPVESAQAAVSSTPVEHDSDAIYLAQSNSFPGRVSAIGQLSFASVGTFVELLSDRPVLSGVCCSKQSSDRSAGLPIYLLVASLRL